MACTSAQLIHCIADSGRPGLGTVMVKHHFLTRSHNNIKAISLRDCHNDVILSLLGDNDTSYLVSDGTQ